MNLISNAIMHGRVKTSEKVFFNKEIIGVYYWILKKEDKYTLDIFKCDQEHGIVNVAAGEIIDLEKYKIKELETFEFQMVKNTKQKYIVDKEEIRDNWVKYLKEASTYNKKI